MLFEMDEQAKGFKPVTGMNIVESLGGNEKYLENYLKETIGDILFPEYLIFGNERAFQREADLFAVNNAGDLIVFELKVGGHYDRGKTYQALSQTITMSVIPTALGRMLLSCLKSTRAFLTHRMDFHN